MASGIVQGQAPRCSTPFSVLPSRAVAPRSDGPRAVPLALEPVPTMPSVVTRAVMQARLGLPPNRPVTGPTTLPALRRSLAQTQLSPLAALTGDLFMSPTPFVAPLVYVPGFGANRPMGLLFDMRYFAALLFDTHTRPNGLSIGVGYLSAAALGGFGIFTHGLAAHSIFGLIGNGFLNVGTGIYKVAPGALQVLTFSINGWRDYLGANFQYLYADTAAHLLTLVSAGFAKVARRDLVNMGPYRGPKSDLLAETHGLPAGTPLRKMELRSRTGESYSFRFGGGMYLLSALLRLDYTRTRERAYRTYVGPDRARALLCEPGGPIRRLLREKARALGWVKEPVAPPNIHDPYALPVGDEVGFTRNRNFIYGVLLGNLGGWIGYNVTHRKDLEIAVRRFGEHQVEVILTPVRVRAPQVYLMSPFGPHVSSRKSHAQALRYGMVFDLRDPEALESYHATVDGDPPGLDIHDTRPYLEHAHALTDTFHTAQAALPSGVRYTFLQLFDAQTLDVGAGIKWMFIPKEILPRGWETGLSYHKLHGRETQAVTDGEQILTSSARTQTKTAELAWSGVRSTQMGTTQRWETYPTGQRLFLGLDLKAQVNETHGLPGDFAEHFIRRFNQQFGLRISAPVHRHPREDRQTQISRMLDDEDVQELAGILAPSTRAQEEAGILRTMNAARQADTSYHALQRLLRALAEEPCVDARNDLIQVYVQKRGLSGFAAVHRLLGGDAADLSIQSASSTYDEALSKGDVLTLNYSDPPAADASAADLAKRWHAIAGGLRGIQLALDGIADDGLLSAEARRGLRTALWTVRSRLFNALPNAPDQIEAMRDWCEGRIWQRRWHRDLLEATRDDTPLLLEAQTTLWTHHAPPKDVDSWCHRWDAVNEQADALQARLATQVSVRGLVPPALYTEQRAELQGALEQLIGPAPHLPRRGLLDLRGISHEDRFAMAEELDDNGPHADLVTTLLDP